jgi:hypothetical protein
MTDGSFDNPNHGEATHPTPLDGGVFASLVGIKLLLHVATGLFSPYGFHRDEFLYIAMGTHLRLWHMDFPPLIAILAKLVHALAGPSLFATRLVPAVAGTLVLVLAVLAAREMGGRRSAQLLAGLAVLCTPLFLRSANLFQPVVLDQLWWTLGLFALLRLRNSGEQRWWIVLGVAGGLGLLTKFSILFFGLAVLIGLLLTPNRRAFMTRWPWLAIGIALVIGAPSIVGQITLGFPVLGQMRVLSGTQLARTTTAEFILGQVLWGPGVVLAAAGLAALLVRSSLRRYREVGWTALAAFVILAALHGKSYYVGPIYPVLFAAGAVLLEGIQGRGPRLALQWSAAATIIGYGVLTLPLGIPILPPERMARYAAALGVTAAVTTNRGEMLPLPQDYADMLGWEEQVEAVARVYAALPLVEQRQAVLFGGNYGRAGALELFGPHYDLPPVVSIVGSFYFFGPGERPGTVTIFVGLSEGDLSDHCGSLELAARSTNSWGVPEERDVPIWVCRSPRETLQETWPSLAGIN